MNKILQEINNTILYNSWDNCDVLVRAMFTTLAYMEEMILSQAEELLQQLYELGDIEDSDVSYKQFKEFMLDDIKIFIE